MEEEGDKNQTYKPVILTIQSLDQVSQKISMDASSAAASLKYNMEIVQDFLLHVPAFPYLWIPHCIMMSWNLRQTYGKDALNLAKSQPLSCFIRALFYTYPGGILAALLASEPPLAFLANTPSILSMIISWYLIFFAPADFFVALLSRLRLAFVFSILQDFQRLQLCLQGVQYIGKTHPHAFLYMTFFATCKSSGFMVIKYVEHLLDHGLVKPFHIPNYPTKTCVLASMAFAADASGILSLGAPSILTYFSFLVLTLRLFVNNQTDPYIWLESLPYGLLYGQPEDSSKKVNLFFTTPTTKIFCTQAIIIIFFFFSFRTNKETNHATST